MSISSYKSPIPPVFNALIRGESYKSKDPHLTAELKVKGKSIADRDFDCHGEAFTDHGKGMALVILNMMAHAKDFLKECAQSDDLASLSSDLVQKFTAISTHGPRINYERKGVGALAIEVIGRRSIQDFGSITYMEVRVRANSQKVKDLVQFFFSEMAPVLPILTAADTDGYGTTLGEEYLLKHMHAPRWQERNGEFVGKHLFIGQLVVNPQHNPLVSVLTSAVGRKPTPLKLTNGDLSVTLLRSSLKASSNRYTISGEAMTQKGKELSEVMMTVFDHSASFLNKCRKNKVADRVFTCLIEKLPYVTERSPTIDCIVSGEEKLSLHVNVERHTRENRSTSILWVQVQATTGRIKAFANDFFNEMARALPLMAGIQDKSHHLKVGEKYTLKHMHAMRWQERNGEFTGKHLFVGQLVCKSESEFTESAAKAG